jgi:hypothetical protein
MEEYKYKYTKYLLKNKIIDMQHGGGRYGCCANNCSRNAYQIRVNRVVNSVCCHLCETGVHTFECDERQKKEKKCICGCERFVECGIDARTGKKFSHCCIACETSNQKIHTHTQECDNTNARIIRELATPYQKESTLPQTQKLKSGKALDKIQMGAFNQTFMPEKNDMQSAITILKNRLREPDGVNETVKAFVVRVLYHCAKDGQKEENIRAGFDFFTELFLVNNIFIIDEAVASIALRMMILINAPKDYVLNFTEKIFREIEITRRVFTSLFALCAKNKDIDFAMELVRIGIIKNIIFRNAEYEDYEYVLECIDSKNQSKKSLALEIMTYMESQDYLQIDGIQPITPKTTQMLCDIFENTTNIANFIVNISRTTCICSKCGTLLKQFNLDTKERQNILDFMEKTQSPQFKHMVDYIKANPATFIIDGANVGYQEEKGKMIINYKKIDIILQTIKANNNTIIFLHNRHQKNITPKDKEIIDRWMRSGIKLCWTPFNMNDDISWMYATLYNDALLISNDEMRDHYVNIYSKISPVNFKLWKELHQISHSFSTGDVVTLEFPPKCLARIQHNSGLWHFPLGNNKWLCLNIIQM